MYHCRVRIYFTGSQSHMSEMIKNMIPLDAFVHEFTESENPKETLAAEADVIFAYMQGMDAVKAVQDLTAWKKPEAELILLTEPKQFTELADNLSGVTDVWTLPMTDAELRFRL